MAQEAEKAPEVGHTITFKGSSLVTYLINETLPSKGTRTFKSQTQAREQEFIQEPAGDRANLDHASHSWSIAPQAHSVVVRTSLTRRRCRAPRNWVTMSGWRDRGGSSGGR